MRLENEAFLESFKQHIELLPAVELAAVTPEERDQMKECFGVYGAETMAVAGRDQTVLWTDDSTLGILAGSTFQARRAWTQIILLSFVEAGVLSKDDYNKAVAKLIGCGYKGYVFRLRMRVRGLPTCRVRCGPISTETNGRGLPRHSNAQRNAYTAISGVLCRAATRASAVSEKEPDRSSLSRCPLGKSCISRPRPGTAPNEFEAVRAECGR